MKSKAKTMKKILVPTDFSKESRYALEVAANIARKTNAEILIAHIIETPGQFYSSDEKFVDSMNGEKQYKMQLSDYFRMKMNEIKEDHKFGDLKIDAKIEMGSTFPCLDNLSIESKADLVVIGCKGIGGMYELLLGSIAQRMIRFSNIPVLTVRDSTDTHNINHIVFATNLKQTPHYVTNELQNLVQILGAQLHLLHINTQNTWRPHREIDNCIEDFAEQHNIKDYTAEVYDDRTVLDGILHYAEDREVDMIALMTHGRTEYSHLVSGSISEQVASLATKPVWTCTLHYDQVKWYYKV